MASKLFLTLLLIASSWVYAINAENNGNGKDTLPCVQKILPCSPYLKSSSPPATCCVPLKEVVKDDAMCLCQVFNNAALMKSFNITQNDALALAKACGANADVSICNGPAAAPTNSNPNNGVAPTGPGTNGGASVIAHYTGSAFTAFLILVLISRIIY